MEGRKEHELDDHQIAGGRAGELLVDTYRNARKKTLLDVSAQKENANVRTLLFWYFNLM